MGFKAIFENRVLEPFRSHFYTVKKPKSGFVRCGGQNQRIQLIFFANVIKYIMTKESALKWWFPLTWQMYTPPYSWTQRYCACHWKDNFVNKERIVHGVPLPKTITTMQCIYACIRYLVPREGTLVSILLCITLLLPGELILEFGTWFSLNRLGTFLYFLFWCCGNTTWGSDVGTWCPELMWAESTYK